MIFVTGATGMVGANLIALFERNNVEYKALKRKSSTLNIVKNVFKIHGIENKIQNIEDYCLSVIFCSLKSNNPVHNI